MTRAKSQRRKEKSVLLVCSQDSNKLAPVNRDQQFELLELAKGKSLGTLLIPKGTPIATLSWQPDSLHLAVQPVWANDFNGSGLVQHWNTETREIDYVTLVLPGAKAVTFNAAGKMVTPAAEAGDELVYMVETDAGDYQLFSGAEFNARAAENSPNGNSGSGSDKD